MAHRRKKTRFMKPTTSKLIPLTQLGWSTPPSVLETAGMNAAPEIEKPESPKSANRGGMPDLSSALYTLNCGQPGFREPENGEFVVGIWREDGGSAAALLLWADPAVDLFFDLALRKHVKPPAFYLRLAEQPKIDAQSGYPIINGAICPF